MTPEDKADFGRRYPLGRIGETEDTADAIVLLASPKAAYITGGTERGIPSLF
ncbi:MAG: SDR family oxidoreductase [bacterium]|nr:SDR family oxidoreductase [bacterium]